MKELLKQIKLYSNALAKASQWNGSKESISIVEAQKSKKNGSDYVYEFFCYMVILSDLARNYDLKFEPGKDKYKHAFPKAPAPKNGKPYFVAFEKGTTNRAFQICAGTEIESSVTSERKPAPDISFQKENTSITNPTHKDVILIIDAKFNRPKSKKKKISLSQFYYVSGMVRDLQMQKTPPVKIKFFELKGIKSNCLITNGEAYSTDLKYHSSHGFKEVEGFDAPFDVKRINIVG